MEEGHSATLLSVLAVAIIHLLFAVAMLQDGGLLKPRSLLLYLIIVGFYGALYIRRRLWFRHRRGGLYRGLGYPAVVLGASLSALLFFSVGTGTALWLAVGVWLALAIAAYSFYRVIVLHLDEAAVQVARRAPV